MKAWLITWENVSTGTPGFDRVAAVLHPQKSTEEVGKIVELLYALRTSTVEELARYAKRPSDNPFRSQFVVEHSAAQARVTCGTHPFLLGRKVTDLSITSDATSLIETISWRDEPTIRFDDSGPVPTTLPQLQSFTRPRSGPPWQSGW